MSAVAIRPRRSMMWFAVLAILMVIASYIFVIALAVVCVYFPFQLLMSEASAGTNSLMLFLFGLIVAGGLLWSLVPRTDKFTPPGPQLSRSQQPRLFAELEAIAASLNEPMPKEVYLTGEVNAWVADRGGMLGFGSRRVMGLGIPLMSVLTVSQFRAVLAHEFAHYYGGDTSLGPWVYKTKMAMVRTFQTMGSVGALARFAVLAVMHLVVSGILRAYFAIFLRATNLVSRKQEFRADELACLVVGPKPLMDGLRVIHGAGPAWVPYWNSEVSSLVNSGVVPPLSDGFSRFLAAPGIAPLVAANIEKELQEGKASPYDTHPPLRERIAAAELLPPASAPDDPRLASQLLEQPEEVDKLFLQALNPSLQTATLRSVPWDQIKNEVTVPSWRKLVSEHGNKFGSVTLESVPDLLPKLFDIGEKLPNPRGRLLDRNQKASYAAELVAVGLALAMLENGWDLQYQPGVFRFQRDGNVINPFEEVNNLFTQKASPETWAARSREWGVSQVVIFSQSCVEALPESSQATD
jgi:heat shock protein HtpX